ncbi:hypothetical protein QJS04_geneDACA009593 [Acorus gramineus]|uniref:Phosphatidylinositol-specific phospholipase C X domain-containing protein n=1 Tax=Acorus gramineus TaxID=55184 RepID=A0AAV9B9E8_ACOGR|nr:hypothetical protein QJS04_geneDACA009593 [Acorus gramineus]
MRPLFSTQIQRHESIIAKNKTLSDLLSSAGDAFPGSDYRPPDHKNWMSGLDPGRLRVDQIVWPGTHNSATDEIGIRFISRPFARCQSLSIYEQLVAGVRALDVRVQEGRRVCHGALATYGVDVVMADVKRFLSETESEVVLLEMRTEFGHGDPPGEYLVDQLGEFLIHQDDRVFQKTLADLLLRRVMCVWKPMKSPSPKRGNPLWVAEHLRDDWIDTDLPWTKFESNMRHMGRQEPVSARKYSYRVENTVTPQTDYPVWSVWQVTERIHGYARLFMAQAVARGFGDRLGGGGKK